jgi:hypothetical protein
MKKLLETMPAEITTYLSNRRKQNRYAKSAEIQRNKRKSEELKILEEVIPSDELESAYPGYSIQKVAEIKAVLQGKYRASPDDLQLFESFIFSLEELSENQDLALLKSKNISAHIIEDLIQTRIDLTVGSAGDILGDQKIEIDSLMSLIPKQHKKIDVEVGIEESSLKALEAGGFSFSYGIFSPNQISNVQTMLETHHMSKPYSKYSKYLEYLVLGSNKKVRGEIVSFLEKEGISEDLIFFLRERRKTSFASAKQRRNRGKK